VSRKIFRVGTIEGSSHAISYQQPKNAANNLENSPPISGYNPQHPPTNFCGDPLDMPVIWMNHARYRLVEYENEADLETAIIQVQCSLFGQDRYYLDIKKKIGAKGAIQNIPDGYLLDLSGAKPRLYFVENELAAHDPLRHIAVQILQFSLSFEAEPLTVKKVLLQALEVGPDAKLACEEYAQERGYRNVDHLLEYLVFESPFSALVVIDSIPENLETVLSEKFRFGVEVLELARYENAAGEHVYHFAPFLEDVLGEPSACPADRVGTTVSVAPDEIDTIVVPARKDGFQETFIGENCWYAVRIHGTVRPQIKYIAAYKIAPISAITHFAPVKAIEPYRDTDKYVLYFSEPAKPIGPLQLVKSGLVRAPQAPRYTTIDRLLKAKNLDDVFAPAVSATANA